MMISPRTVYLVGAGPGDPGLITLRGYRLLQQADVILHDRLCAHELLDGARPDAEIIDVGKAPGTKRSAQSWINDLLVARAKAGKSVVRLKGGDPFVFGRGYEELQACREAGVPCLVIPGVTSAVAAPAAVGIPLTHRGLVRTLAIVTASATGNETTIPLDFHALAAMDTVVVLMGCARLAEIAAALIDAGKDASCPVACIQNATTNRQRVVCDTLGTIAGRVEQAGLRPPIVTVIGAVAAFAEREGSALLQAVLNPGI